MQLCENYVTQLLGMSFLQYSKTSSSDRRQDKDDTSFMMHDLVHDLAKEILSHQINAGEDRCRYALLTDCSSSLQSFVAFPANIRALHFWDCGNQELYGGAFSTAKRLCILDLSECSIPKLPDCIGQLKQLRFLHAPGIMDKTIPYCITELSELNYLNLRGSHISALPESIGEMKALMHLDLSGCREIHELPVSFAELKELVHLDLSYCKIYTSEAFVGLTKLQHLNLLGQTIMDADMRGLSEVIGNLTKLRYLNLSECIGNEVTSDQINCLIGSISTLSSLEHLNLSNHYYYLSSIPESIGNLRKLHTLDLSGYHGLKKLPNSMDQMVSLKVLILDQVRLDRLEVSRFNCASLPHFEVHASSDKCSSNINRLWPTNPTELWIDKLENVKSAEEAHSIKLIEKQKIKKLKFQWTVDAGRFMDDKEVLEKLVPPISVQTLTIVGYRSVSLPGWLMSLPNLWKLDLWNFPNCNNLQPLGQLPNLIKLSLYSMEVLEELNTTHYTGKEGSKELMFPKLRSFFIHQCGKLRIKPCLPRAEYLYICGSDTMLSSWGESPSHSCTSFSSPLTMLHVSESKVPMHEWRLLHHLPALRDLTISGCSDLTTSPQIIYSLSSLESLCLDQAELPRWLVGLTSLQALRLKFCTPMTSLPEWLGELPSLKKFELTYCKGIRSLPDSIQQLTKLECLVISRCPTLEKWCESKENKRKLAHITEVIPVSLRADPRCTFTHWWVDGDVIRSGSAMMHMSGFTEEALRVAVSHLEKMGMHEDHLVLWLRSFLAKQAH